MGEVEGPAEEGRLEAGTLGIRTNPQAMKINFQLWSRRILLHLADITNNSTISMAISKVVISENVPCNGWLWK
jgi:hypothetical protein